MEMAKENEDFDAENPHSEPDSTEYQQNNDKIIFNKAPSFDKLVLKPDHKDVNIVIKDHIHGGLSDSEDDHIPIQFETTPLFCDSPELSLSSEPVEINEWENIKNIDAFLIRVYFYLIISDLSILRRERPELYLDGICQ